jgi:sulfopyruvate decarboxylase subunit beta
MNAKDAIAAVHAARGPRDIVVTTMMPARDWMMLPQNPLDMVLVPSAMSHATSMGLGLALAQPDRRVIVCNGDGSMLMNLGSLVSIVAAGVTNMLVVLFDNGSYAVTGAQPIPGAGKVNYLALAAGAGFTACSEYSTIDSWRSALPTLLGGTGPTFAVLHVDPSDGPGPKSRGPAGERAQRFMDAIRATAEPGENP